MINKLAREIHEINVKNGFYEDQKNTGEMLALIHSEVSEALEADRKGKYAVDTWNIVNNTDDLDLSRTSDANYFKQEFEVAYKDTFEDELADVIIRVLDMAAFRGIDLEKHILAKMKYNSLREYKHGKKY